MKSVCHGIVDHATVYEPDEDDMAAWRQLALEEFESAQRVLVKNIGRCHLGVRARGAHVVACNGTKVFTNLFQVMRLVPVLTDERVEDEGRVIGELAS